MQIIHGRSSQARYLERGALELSRAARARLAWIDSYHSYGRNSVLTCRHFRHPSPDLLSLEAPLRTGEAVQPEGSRPHRPRRLRQPIRKPQLAEQVLRLRRQYSRWNVLEAHSRATALFAAQFLDTLPHRVLCPVRALQVDGGREFAAFERACQQRGL